MRRIRFNYFASFTILALLAITYSIFRIKTSKFTSNAERNFVDNFQYIYNNNIAQYSSYIIIEKTSFYHIEALIVRSGKNEDFVCVLKYHKDQKNEIVQLNVDKMFRSHHNESKKLSFKLNLNSFKSYLENPPYFEVDSIVLAVILKSDFYLKDALKKTNQDIFPFSFITYQKPIIIKAYQPRLPSVGLCVHKTYQINSFLSLKNWIDYHLSFGIGDIRFYDAIENKTLTKFIEKTYGKNKKLTVVPYQRKVISSFDYQKRRFNRLIDIRGGEITRNDCFTVLRCKHEFVAHYDLDEFIFPRSLNNYEDFYKRQSNYSCENKNSICSLNPFGHSKDKNYFYNYLNSLIEKERKGRDREKLRSVDFRRTIAFKPSDENTILTINQLKNIIEATNSHEIHSYPLDIFIRMNKLKNLGYRFLIEKKDVDYVKYLYRSYENLVPCSFNKYLKESINRDLSLIRFLYFVTEYGMKDKNYKKIHYYKNVNTIFTHWPLDYEEDTWTFIPSPENGHIVHHFREQFKPSQQNFTDSIRLLSVDYEYLFFLLKRFSKFC